MARNISAAVQQYRGTTDQHSTYTGPVGEITVDTTKNTAVVHDGSTAGGHPLAKEALNVTASGGVLVNSGSATTLANDIAITLGVQISYTETTGSFILQDSAGGTIATATIPAATSLLEAVEFLTTYQEQSGAWLHFTFRLSSGDTEDLYVDVSSLIDTYTAGTGITVTDHEVSVDQTWLNQYLVSVEATVVSTDADNVITAGTDGGAYLTAATIASYAAANITAGAGITIVSNTIAVDTTWLDSQLVTDLGTMD